MWNPVGVAEGGRRWEAGGAHANAAQGCCPSILLVSSSPRIAKPPGLPLRALWQTPRGPPLHTSRPTWLPASPGRRLHHTVC